VPQQVLCSQLHLRCRKSNINWIPPLLGLRARRSMPRFSIGDDSMFSSAASGLHIWSWCRKMYLSQQKHPSFPPSLPTRPRFAHVCVPVSLGWYQIAIAIANTPRVLPTSTPARLGKQLRKQNDSDQMHGSTIASFQKLAVADAKRPTHALWASLKQATDPSPNCRGTDAMIREKQNFSYCSKKIDRLLPLPVPPSQKWQKQRARKV
jgi:hypothetical protein